MSETQTQPQQQQQPTQPQQVQQSSQPAQPSQSTLGDELAKAITDLLSASQELSTALAISLAKGEINKDHRLAKAALRVCEAVDTLLMIVRRARR